MLKRILAFIAAMAITSSIAFAQENTAQEEQKPTATKEQLLAPMEGDVIIGDKNAKVTVIEYASMSCPHCAMFHNNTYENLKEKYIDSGKVRFIFRPFPLDEPALRGSMMASCAGDDKFEKFTKVLFSTQSNWAPKKNYLEVLSNIGKLGGMKGEDFDKCIADKELENKIMMAKFNAIKQLDVRSTPTFFINGEIHKGAKDFEYFTRVFDAALGADAPIQGSKN